MALTDDIAQQAAEKEAMRKQEALAQFLQKRADEDLRAVLLTAAGRRTLFGLMRDNGYFGGIALGAGLESRVGQRESSVRLRQRVEAVDVLLPSMMEREWLTADGEKTIADAAGAA